MQNKKQLMLLFVATVTVGFLTLAAPLFAASTEQVLYSFCPVGGCVDGYLPQGGVIRDIAGNLYGTTKAGGYGTGCFIGCGTVFELTSSEKGTWNETVLYSFNNNGTDGYFPEAGLIFDAAGNLYGTTSNGGGLDCQGYGCGTVFRLAHGTNGTWTETVLYSFNGNSKGGMYPSSGRLVVDAAGNLYGTTYLGGSYRSGCYGRGCGTVFELSPGRSGAWTESVLHSFKGPDGAQPTGGLVVDVEGNLYGTTWFGGSSGCDGAGCGIVFELAPGVDGKWTEKVLRRFYRLHSPHGSLIFDATGNLYGTTSVGGPGCRNSYGCGIVFQLSPGINGMWTGKNVFHFNKSNGFNPHDGLTMDAAGNLYGMTSRGGAYDYGTVFELTPGSNGAWSETVLQNFDGGNNGYNPMSGLTFDSAGNLYGTVGNGGADGGGAVFQITP